MNRYTKIINMMESYFTKDFEKTKKGFTKVREVKEETVRKAFLKGNCEVLVILEDSNREILITISVGVLTLHSVPIKMKYSN